MKRALVFHRIHHSISRSSSFERLFFFSLHKQSFHLDLDFEPVPIIHRHQPVHHQQRQQRHTINSSELIEVLTPRAATSVIHPDRSSIFKMVNDIEHQVILLLNIKVIAILVTFTSMEELIHVTTNPKITKVS